MEERIAQLEAQVRDLHNIVNRLLTEFLPPVCARIAALEKRDAGTANPAPADPSASATAAPKHKRQATSYAMYMSVKKLHDLGYEPKIISKELGIPYTTVRSYIQMEPEKVEKLKEKQDKADAKVLKKEPAETPVEASAPVETPAPVVDTTTGEVQDVEVTPVADAPQGYAVECPVSPEPFGSEGWREWTAELRDYAKQYRDETGYPLYYPTLPVNTVSVQYMNEVVETGVAAGSVDWAFGGVIRWKIAS